MAENLPTVIRLMEIAKTVSEKDKTPGLSLEQNLKRVLVELRDGKMVVSINKNGEIMNYSSGGAYFLNFNGDKVVDIKKDKFFFRYYEPFIENGKIKGYKLRQKKG